MNNFKKLLEQDFSFEVEYTLPNGKRTRVPATGERFAKAIKKDLEANQFKKVKIIKTPIKSNMVFNLS